jgi:uncharacterized protein YukE
MGDIRVELESLGGLVRSFAGSAEHISAATGALTSVSASDLGSGDLDGAVHDFQDRWGSGIKKISEAASKITDELQSAKTTYEQIEQKAIEALEKVGGQQGGAPPPGGGGNDPAQSKIGRALAGGAL